MGMSWITQVRLLYVAILALTSVSLVVYISHMSTPRPHTTISPVILPVTFELHARHTNTAQLKAVDLCNMLPSKAPSTPSSNDSLVPNLTRGVLTKTIYDPGHINIGYNICPDLGKNLQLVIIITSAPAHKNARMVIRQTWGHFAAQRDVTIAFMLGSTFNAEYLDEIYKEKYMYEDIIQGKYVDTYENLTLKTISMLEWVENYCPKAAFVLKTDDDIFINIPCLLTFITKQNLGVKAFYGCLAQKWKPFRDKQSKYYISPQQYKPEVFPDFTTGPAYLFPASLAKDLYAAALNHTYFMLEDVFLTGFVANELKIERVHVPEFLNEPVSLTTYRFPRGISFHMVNETQLIELWNNYLMHIYTQNKNNVGCIRINVVLVTIVLTHINLIITFHCI